MSVHKKWERIRLGAVAAALAAAITLVPLGQPMPVYAADSVDALKQKQAQYQQQQDANNKKLESLRKDKSQKQAYIDTLQSQQKTLQGQIDTYNAQISKLDQRIVETQDKIKDKQKSIDSNTNLLKDRLRALYMAGEASNLEILLSADSLVDMADKAQALELVTKHDTELINTLNADMASIKDQKTQIESDRKNVATAKVSLDTKRKDLVNLESEAQKALSSLSASADSLEAENKKLAEQEDKASAELDAWYKKYEAQKQQQKPKAPNSGSANQGNTGGGGGSTGGGSAGGGSGGGSATGTGALRWPVPGCHNITSGFGGRWGKMHKGIDISNGLSSYGAPIVAADSGTVAASLMGYSGSGFGGYGNVVLIDHGNGMSTLYAHMSARAVQAGQTVKKGQIVGYMGNTGNVSGATGIHLHFEVRINGSAVNPERYL